nr:hypothetical protein [Tanacetum cinerariifolium]
MQQTKITELRENDRRHQAQMVETLRVIGDIRREMGNMQAKLLAQRKQSRRARQLGGDARVPNHQDAPRDYPATVAMSGVFGAETHVHTLAPGESEAQNELPGSIKSKPRVDKHNLLRGGISISGISSLRSTGGGMYRGGGSGDDDDGNNGDGMGGGNGHAARAVHLARRSLAEGGDSEISGDGDGVGMARSLSTSASGGKDM